MNKPKTPFWEVRAAKNGGEIYIYGDITSRKWDEGDVTAADFAKALDGLGEVKALDIYINSGGGDVFAGQAIYSILKRHKARKNVYVDGLAASIASVIAMAGDAIYMPANAMMMVHNPWAFSAGNATELRKLADALDKIRETLVAAYRERVTIGEAELSKLMDDETWMTAKECLEHGFCTHVVEEKRLAASLGDVCSYWNNLPEALKGGGSQSAYLAELVTRTPLENVEIKKILGGL